MMIKRLKYFIFSTLIAFGLTTYAQQLPQYTNYMLNNYVLNPAVGGIDPYFIGVSTNRYQWVGLTDAPRTYILSVNGPTKTLKVGLGGMLFTDIVGPTRRTGMSLSYAYHFKMSEKVKLALGLSGGLLQFKVDGSKIQLRNQTDVVINNGVQSLIAPDFGFGFHLYNAQKIWYLGVSAPQMMQDKVEFYNIKTASTSRLNRHYYITGGYKFYVGDNFKIEPSTCIKYVKPAPLQYDLGLRLIYLNKLWIGGVYRDQDATSVIVGYSTNSDLIFMYSYDFTSSNIKKYSSGTHEVMIGLVFNRIKVKDLEPEDAK